MMIAMRLAHQDPKKAIALIEQVPGEQERRNMAEMITDRWVQQDPDAALSWLLQSDAANDSVMMKAAQTLAQVDLDSAMRWLPRVDERHQSMWRSTIAAHLAAQESPATAESFIARFQHSPDYPQLVASVAAGIARTDIDSIDDRKIRQQGLTNLVYRVAQSDIRRAESLLDEIDLDEDERRRMERNLQSMHHPAPYIHF